MVYNETATLRRAKRKMKRGYVMKKVLCLVLIMVFGLSLVACGVNLEKVEESIQGEWILYEEGQFGSSEKLLISNGSVTKYTYENDNWTVLNGSYIMDSKGFAVITYTDGSTQTIESYVTEDGYVLKDSGTLAYYVKKS